MKRIFLLCVFFVTHAYAQQEEPVQESPFRAGITLGLGAAGIHGEGDPKFDPDEVRKNIKNTYTGPISGKISNLGFAGMVGAYFSYAFSNYISGEIQVNPIVRGIFLHDKEVKTLEGDEATPMIALFSGGLSFPLLGCLHPFGSQNGLKLLAGMALDFLTLRKEFKKAPMGIEKDKARDVDFTNFKDKLRNWDVAFVIGIGYEWRSGWGLGIRHHRGLLGFLKKDGLADELFTGSDITGIKNIKNHHTIITLNYSIIRP
ncbi:outer membrane beta-barrel protein [Candidatus Cardinium hertigii]|uniref:Uncharacterized protein n=1 Tax=Candidatus Cardinium hertigii TaxID=247481 RepID=A0A2Z3LHF8_9BACT|nr:outer membrane beta-barrel protein [Candidatus Cardinium hertigii]AWN81874.1 hypothetical protein DK880_00556 [Candidatus Cardinium hertigii]